MQSITITLDEEMADALRDMARNQGGRSVSSLIREAVTEKLERVHIEEAQPEEAER